MADLRSSLTLLSAGDPLLQLADVKLHLKIDVDESDQDDYLNMLIDAAQAHLEGRDGILGRAFLTQQWRLTLSSFYDPVCSPWNSFRAGEIRIPLPPLASVESVKYLDSTETLQTVSSSLYRIVDGGGQVSSIIPKVGQVWPIAICAPDAVRIEFTAGYTDDDGDADPESFLAERKDIVHAMLFLIGHWFQNREGVTDGRVNQPFELPFAIDALLSKHRVFF